MRTFTLLVVLLEPLLRGELLRVGMLRVGLLRRELLRVELIRGELLREEILLRLVEALGIVVLVGVLTDRDEVVVLEELDLLIEGCRLRDEEDREVCRLLEDEEGLEVCRLLELLPLDLLLLLDAFSAKTGSIVSIRAKNNVPTKILTFLGYFSVAIILLLKYLM
ncbi:MAG: hypothetical protein FVQ84_06405 [Planctomycetes bacterium]|nr:hypothetical protein [Planctomycetota bacterium]